MLVSEPTATALLLTSFGVLLLISVLFSRTSDRFGVPVVLIFLVIGVLAGAEGLGGIEFDDYGAAFRLGTVALALILFDGGLNTPVQAIRRYIAPAGVLATVGVVGTAALVAWGAYIAGFPWTSAMLLGAIVSSTDAAAVFSVLRGSGLHLKRRVAATLEIESGVNDPTAVILTIALTANLLDPQQAFGWNLVGSVVGQLVIGGVAGAAIGWGGRFIVTRFRLPSGGLTAALTLAIACVAFGLPTVLYGSGFLSVYVAAVILGNADLPYRTSLIRVHDALAWLSQIVMFLMLGLLATPSRVAEVAGVGIALALFLAIVARPAMVWLCLLPFRYPAREIAYVGWVGLRGAVPIILATFPVLAGAPAAEIIFDVVFVIVVVNALVPGGTVRFVTRWLKLHSDEPPAPRAVLEIETTTPLRGQLTSYYITEALAVAGVPLRELPFPDGASATLIVRGQELIAPRGSTVLQPGDHVYIFSQPEDKPLMQLMFGRPEED